MWNYRILKKNKGSFVLVEAYYNGDGSLFAITDADASPFGESKKQLRRDLRAMRRAFKRPVLIEGKINFHPHKDHGKE